MATKVFSKTFQKAAELVGGQKNLARRLRVPQVELQKWIAGDGQPPNGIFLKAVDLVLEEMRYPRAGSEPAEPPAANDCAEAGAPSYAFL